MSFTQLSQSYPIARKEHICIWCGEKIEKGEKYYCYSGIGDDGFQTNKLHLECRIAMDKHFRLETPFENEFMPYEFKRGSTEQR